MRGAFVPKVNEVLIVKVDADVSERAPSFLDFLGGDRLFALLSLFSPTLDAGTPCPLDLNGSDVVHREPMVLEETASERHFVRCLNQSSTEILHAAVLIFGHHIEG